jgi:peptide subunit release factor 1 (eRF1)
MVYDWAGKREICYQMYIQEKKPLEEIMEYMRTAYQFAPRYGFTLIRELLFVGHQLISPL